MGGPAGLWRAGQDDGLYWTLLIDESGTGWIECGRRPDYESITEFVWTASGPDRVEFVFGACREVEDGEVVHTRPAEERSSHTFTLSERESPGGPVAVLTLEKALMGARAFTGPAPVQLGVNARTNRMPTSPAM
jgi:hypothetical protein